MKTLFLTIAPIILLSTTVAPACCADENDKQIVHDKVTDSVLKTCRAHQRKSETWGNRERLNTPNYSDEKVVAWVTTALPNIMSLDYRKIEEQLRSGEKYFTPNGWCEFIAAMSDANIIDAAITRKLEVTMILHAAPKIIERVVNNDVYIWTVEVPVSFMFKSGGVGVPDLPDRNGEKLVIRISRSSSRSNSDGIGISQWVTVHDDS